MMVDLGRLEQRLNQDARLREMFFADPVATLRREGLLLSQAQGLALREAVARSKSSPPRVPGASIPPVTGKGAGEAGLRCMIHCLII